jgi:hypothetical protein
MGETDSMKPRRRRIALWYGLIAGLSLIVFTTVLYRGGVTLFLGGVAYLGYVILIGLAVAAALAEKKSQGGYLDFQVALKTCFTVFVIALVAQTLFVWLLLNVIDTNFKKVLAEAAFKKTEAVLTDFGLTQDQLDRTIASARDKDQFAFGSMLQGLAFSCIVHFILALPIAAIVKKKK